jgi:hypothetical protein
MEREGIKDPYYKGIVRRMKMIALEGLPGKEAPQPHPRRP